MDSKRPTRSRRATTTWTETRWEDRVREYQRKLTDDTSQLDPQAVATSPQAVRHVNPS